jgi:hypothetical protein
MAKTKFSTTFTAALTPEFKKIKTYLAEYLQHNPDDSYWESIYRKLIMGKELSPAVVALVPEAEGFDQAEGCDPRLAFGRVPGEGGCLTVVVDQHVVHGDQVADPDTVDLVGGADPVKGFLEEGVGFFLLGGAVTHRASRASR